ncbi:MAG: 2Fe-2S iron-sulfur cluster-binding protein [Janthinobacterium lividum]
MSAPYQVTLTGSDVAFACEAGENLLRAGLRQGVPLAYECNVGACGTCKYELLSGEIEEISTTTAGLRPKERERGRRLACQSIALSDCTIKMRTGAEYQAPVLPLRLNATFESQRDITHDIREFTFKSAGPANFLAGQYALLELPGQPARAYSMSNLANDAGIWQFMVRRVPEGAVSPLLFDKLTPGTAVVIDGPYGLAYWRQDVPRGLVCIAGGSGLAPIASILKGAAHAPVGSHRDAYLFYGGRGPADVPSISGIFETATLPAALNFHPVVSVPALVDGTDWDGEVGFVHEIVPHKLSGALTDYEYYLAGPPPMVEAVVKLLIVEHKVPQSQIHFDRFF